MQIIQDMRTMGHFDLEPIMAIEQNAYDFPWTIGIMSDCLKTRAYECYVYEVAGEIKAYIIFHCVLDEVHLLNICVSPEYQKCGFGQAIITWLIDFSANNSSKTIYLEVRSSNNSAINLYNKLGFNEIGIRPNYYPAKKGKEDALLFAYELF